MERKEIKMYSDYKSPFAYLAFDPAFALETRYRIRLRWIPFQLRIKGKGERSQYSEYKARYSYLDARRWAKPRGLIIRGPLKVYDTTPALIGGLWAWSWQGAVTAFFWGALVRIGLLHHVTWSINSICHAAGERTFKSRDKSGNVWWLALLSFGESWHNLHHADPTCARHGVLRGQVDISARTIWIFEKLGWVRDVRWPRPERIAAKLAR